MKIAFFSTLFIFALIISPITYIALGSNHFSYPREDIDRDLESIKFKAFSQLFHKVYGNKTYNSGDYANIGGIEQEAYRVIINFENYPFELEGQKIQKIQLSNIKFIATEDKKYFEFIAAPWNTKTFDPAKYQIAVRMIIESTNNNRLIIGPVLFQNNIMPDQLATVIVSNFNKDTSGKEFDVFHELLFKSRADYPTWSRAIKASLSTFLPGFSYEFKPISDTARITLALIKCLTWIIFVMLISPIGFLVHQRFTSIRSQVYKNTPLAKIDKKKK